MSLQLKVSVKKPYNEVRLLLDQRLVTILLLNREETRALARELQTAANELSKALITDDDLRPRRP